MTSHAISGLGGRRRSTVPGQGRRLIGGTLLAACAAYIGWLIVLYA
jgi:hypothetical protein